jgi:hypothetical protein
MSERHLLVNANPVSREQKALTLNVGRLQGQGELLGGENGSSKERIGWVSR